MVAEVLGEFGGGVIDGGWNCGLLAWGDHMAGRGERVYEVYEGRHGKVGELADEVVLGTLEDEAAMVDDGVQNASDPPVLIDVGGLVDGLEVDLDLKALSFEDEHVGVEFLHGIRLNAKNLGAPPLIQLEHFLLGGFGRGFTAPGFEDEHTAEMIDPDDGDGSIGAYSFEGIGAFLFAGWVQKPVNV